MKNNKPTIAQSLVLCHYSTTAPSTTVLNRSATARATSTAGAERHAARVYNTVLTARGTAIGRAISLQQRTGVSIRRFGLPCPMGGMYLRIRDVTNVQNVFDDAIIELDTIREDILATYPSLVSGLRIRLGKFADEVTIPSATEVASRFTMHLSIISQPVPVADGVLGGLAAEVANRVRAESQQQINEMLKRAHAGPIDDLKQVLAEFIDRMRNAERLHLSQFDKLRVEARRVASLNVLDIPEINQLVDQLTEIPVPDTVPSHAERADIASRVEKISAQADMTLATLGL